MYNNTNSARIHHSRNVCACESTWNFFIFGAPHFGAIYMANNNLGTYINVRYKLVDDIISYPILYKSKYNNIMYTRCTVTFVIFIVIHRL